MYGERPPSEARGRVWIFDLDNTLHDASPHIFPHISAGMTAYLARQLGIEHEEASRLRVRYWQRYGATLLGMMKHHGTDPRHFLWHTHQFPELDRMLVADAGLRHALRRLPGRKLLLSNAPQHYVEAVLQAIGIRALFSRVYAIEGLRFRPKPDRHAFLRLLRRERLHPRRCVMVEDSLENLVAAKSFGMKTVWVTRRLHDALGVDLRIKSVLDLPRLLARL
jgi:putative hydrolase of the HAD superfamily